MKSGDTTIDDLPEGVLLHILPFLPATTATQTSAVAPKWHNLWHSVPILDFDVVEFHSRFPDVSMAVARQLFAEFISQTLVHQPGHSLLAKCRLYFDYKKYEYIRDDVDSWVNFIIVDLKAIELELDFEVFPYNLKSSRKQEDRR